MSIADSIDIKALLGLAPEKAIEYLDSKGLYVGWNWQDTLDEAHARSFTIAKMTQLDLLSDTRKAIMQAMADGTGFKGFEQTITPVMQAKGWWGYKAVVNPSGEAQLVKLGTPRRLATIYHTNRRSAVMSAKYVRMMEAVDTHPYWQYIHHDSAHPRLNHVALHGVVYAADDPFWSHGFPPNGFGCKCTVKALTASRAEKAGIAKSDMRSFTQDIGLDQSSGEIYQATRHGTKRELSDSQATTLAAKARVSPAKIKNVIAAPDAGFNGSPAAGHLMDQLWLDKAKSALGDQAALEAIAKDMASEARVRGFIAWMRTTSGMGYSQSRTYGIGLLSNKAMAQFAKHLPESRMGSPVVAFQDHLISGKKARRHAAAGDALDLDAYERIVRDFGKPDYELWDTQNKHVLHVFNKGNGKVVKLSIGMEQNGAQVVSAFEVGLNTITEAIAGRVFIPLQ